jgi:TonB family protein
MSPRPLVPIIAALVLSTWASPASAFPGFFVGTSEGARPHGTSTSVVLLREDTLSVVTVQTDYVGPLETFALVIPVRAGVVAGEVRALPPAILERLERVSAPVLVERWERDPCSADTRRGVTGLEPLGTIGHGTSSGYGYGMGYGDGAGSGSGYGSGAGAGDGEEAAHAEALQAGEYAVTIVAPADGAAFATWLTEQGYHLPVGLEAAVAPVIAAGFQFLVARVDASALTFVGDRAVLSPLRFHQHEDELSLPLALATLDGDDAEDLVIDVLARSGRYDVVGRTTRLAPTNVVVTGDAHDRFDAVYASVLDRIFARDRDIVVTEHAASAAVCDACDGGHPVRTRDLATLGATLAFSGGVFSHEQRGFRTWRSPVPTVQIGAADVRSGAAPNPPALSREVIRRVLRRHQNEIRFCYEQELAQRPDLAGRVTVSFIINATGAVQTASVANTTLSNARVEGCIVQAVRRWTFPEPDGGGIVGVSQPFTLRSSGGDPYGPSTVRPEWVLTRLHARLAQGEPLEDWTLAAAPAVRGGDDDSDAPPSEGGAEAAPRHSRFQTRFVLRHPWEEALACDAPRRELWGAPERGPIPPSIGSTRAAGPTRIELATLLASPLAELELDAPAVEPEVTPLVAAPEPIAAPEPVPAPEEPAAPHAAPPPAAPASCSCRASTSSGRAWTLALFGLALALLARRAR